jgi:predicted RNA-binding protein YlxR (DUF448 family)
VARLPKGDAMRTCIGCRETKPRDVLLRLTLRGDPPQVRPDLNGQLGGRGASIHPSRTCIIAAVKRRAFTRAWMREVTVSTEELLTRVKEAYRLRVEKLLLSAQRKRAIEAHIDLVRKAIQMRHVELLVVAKDASGSVSDRAQGSARLGRRVLFFGTEESMGRLLGSCATSVVAVFDRAIAQELTRAAECMAALAEGA